MAVKLLSRFIKNNRLLFYAGIVVVPVIAQIMFISLILIYQLIAKTSLSQSADAGLVAVCLGYIVVLIFFQYLKERASVTFRSKLGEELKAQLGQLLISAKPAATQKGSLGRLIETLQNVELLCRLPEVYISIFISIFQLLLVSLYVVYEISWKMLLVLAVLVGLSVAVSLLSNPLNRKQRNVAIAEEKLINLSKEISSGLEIIKNYAKETFFYNAYRKLSGQQTGHEADVGRYETGINLLNKLLSFLILTGAPLIAWLFIRNQGNIEGKIITISLIYGFLAQSFSTLLAKISEMHKLQASAELFNEFFNQSVEKERAPIPFQVKENSTNLQADHIYFSYPEDAQPILRGVSINLGSTGLIAIVGESGAGKSSLLKTLAGLNEETSGAIRNGQSVLSAPQRRWLFSYASQETWLLPGTVFENVEYANEAVSHDEYDIFLSGTGLAELVERFVAGSETLIENGGINLSGGQRQLINVLRALRKEADLFIFDEPTSAQGARSEEMIAEALKKLGRTKIVVVATHRLKIAQMADCIYVMEEGRVSEEGSHNELINKKGKYFKLFQYEVGQQQ